MGLGLMAQPAACVLGGVATPVETVRWTPQCLGELSRSPSGYPHPSEGPTRLGVRSEAGEYLRGLTWVYVGGVGRP